MNANFNISKDDQIKETQMATFFFFNRNRTIMSLFEK